MLGAAQRDHDEWKAMSFNLKVQSAILFCFALMAWQTLRRMHACCSCTHECLPICMHVSDAAATAAAAAKSGERTVIAQNEDANKNSHYNWRRRGVRERSADVRWFYSGSLLWHSHMHSLAGTLANEAGGMSARQ